MDNENKLSFRENYLLSIISKLIHEYKSLRASLRQKKLFSIIGINTISPVPGETEFAVKVSNKNCTLPLSAADLIRDYNLSDFSHYHADLIREAAKGTLIKFLDGHNGDPLYRIFAKKIDRTTQQYVFVIENKNKEHFTRTAQELSKEKEILMNLHWQDIFDVGCIHGMERIIKEKCELELAKKSSH